MYQTCELTQTHMNLKLFNRLIRQNHSNSRTTHHEKRRNRKKKKNEKKKMMIFQVRSVFLKHPKSCEELYKQTKGHC